MRKSLVQERVFLNKKDDRATLRETITGESNKKYLTPKTGKYFIDHFQSTTGTSFVTEVDFTTELTFNTDFFMYSGITSNITFKLSNGNHINNKFGLVVLDSISAQTVSYYSGDSFINGNDSEVQLTGDSRSRIYLHYSLGEIIYNVVNSNKP